jgi:hypothetical protein
MADYIITLTNTQDNALTEDRLRGDVYKDNGTYLQAIIDEQCNFFREKSIQMKGQKIIEAISQGKISDEALAQMNTTAELEIAKVDTVKAEAIPMESK